MTEDEVEIKLDDSPVGQVEPRSRQTDDRITLPERFWEHLNVEKGEKVVAVCKEKSIEITTLTKERILGE